MNKETDIANFFYYLIFGIVVFFIFSLALGAAFYIYGIYGSSRNALWPIILVALIPCFFIVKFLFKAFKIKLYI